MSRFEISLEEFEKLEDLGKRPRPKILENVAEKIKEYDAQCKAPKYNATYRRVLKAREGDCCLVDADGNVSERALKVIEDALRAFEMGRQMGGKFRERLRKKLEDDEIRSILKRFRNLCIDSLDLKEFKDDVKRLYEALSASGSSGLSSRQDSFEVGATKIMNFLFPELFIMVDSNVKKAVGRSGPGVPFGKYWDIMMICRRELEEHKKVQGSYNSLLESDIKPTTLTRIFDKCAFIMGKSEI